MRNQPHLTAGALGKRGKRGNQPGPTKVPLGKRGKGGISQVLQGMPWKRKEKVESMDVLERRGVEITRSYNGSRKVCVESARSCHGCLGKERGGNSQILQWIWKRDMESTSSCHGSPGKIAVLAQSTPSPTDPLWMHFLSSLGAWIPPRENTAMGRVVDATAWTDWPSSITQPGEFLGAGRGWCMTGPIPEFKLAFCPPKLFL